ncbi:MAG: hypothetical protein KDN18_16230 [Verrucomicrobiae bacterium]|nr:hypothetical protein [Verrucomicrobiae bacterium]
MVSRRNVLRTTAGLAGGALADPFSRSQGKISDYENPYEDVDWDRWITLDSMSHQHQGQTEASLDLFREMGYGHFAFSNYYPSAPTFPLPASWQETHPEIVAAPNAEQHSFVDSGLHANSLGSLLATGYGLSVPAATWKQSPLVNRFYGLKTFAESRPWEGVYRLDLRFEGKAPAAAATLSVDGATECVLREGFAVKGEISARTLPAGNHTLYLRVGAPELTITLDFDPGLVSITQFRLMQGSNRPWREVFRAALDGEELDGQRRGGLLYPDGGGITLNHPTGKLDDYAAMLDFDPRVLGIEVWNQLTSGFGSDRGFYEAKDSAPDHFYRLWDEILTTGRRCWGFFVKDHNTYGRGRNVLLVPALEGRDRTDREATALRAYRQGTFFGSVSAITTNEAGEVVAPYDRSGFRFRRLELKRDKDGNALALECAVGGQDEARRPNVQIRIITDQGLAAVVDGNEGEWLLPRDGAGKAAPLFIRVEAIAYPDTHAKGKPLTPEAILNLRVAEIARLHDRQAERGRTFFGNPAELRTPVPVADLIFSQPMLKR